MPLYEYTCNKCHKNFEILRPSSERDQRCECSHCGAKSTMKRLSSLVSSAGAKSPLGAGASCGPSSSGFG